MQMGAGVTGWELLEVLYSLIVDWNGIIRSIDIHAIRDKPENEILFAETIKSLRITFYIPRK